MKTMSAIISPSFILLINLNFLTTSQSFESAYKKYKNLATRYNPQSKRAYCVIYFWNRSLLNHQGSRGFQLTAPNNLSPFFVGFGL